MSLQDRADQHQFGARTVGQRHGGQRQLLQRLGRERRHQIMRQRGQRMGQRLAGMAARVETELGLERGEARAQHRHLMRRAGQRGAGPQPGMDRQADDAAPFHHRYQHQVERHRAMYGRDRIRLEQQRRRPALYEIIQRALARGVGEQRHLVRRPRDAKCGRVATVLIPFLMAQQRQLAAQEPQQQRRALAILLAQRRRIGGQCVLQPRPVGYGGPDIGQYRAQIIDQPAPVARIGAFHFQIDEGFGLSARADGLKLSLAVACHGQDGVDHAVDRNAVRPDHRRDRIDQEGHVVIDDGQAHPPVRVVARHGLQRDRRFARRALLRHARDEGRRSSHLRGAEPLQLRRKGALGQPRGNRVGHRMRHIRCHGAKS